MFIKKDERKIRQILEDPEDDRVEMRLARRKGEFDSGMSGNGTLKVICNKTALPALSSLEKLSVYDNSIASINGISLLGEGATRLHYLNLGRNNLRKLPMELSKVQTLRTLWVDDNMLDEFPKCLLQLTNLEELRLSGNQITEVPEAISNLTRLRTLALDNNGLKSVPAGIGKLYALQTLLLRQNELTDLPDEICGLSSLKDLHISSNLMVELPSAIGALEDLQNLYANGNKIAIVSSNLAQVITLCKANLSNNQISVLPEEWIEAWGHVDAEGGRLSSSTVEILLKKNPIVMEILAKKEAKAKELEKENAANAAKNLPDIMDVEGE